MRFTQVGHSGVKEAKAKEGRREGGREGGREGTYRVGGGTVSDAGAADVAPVGARLTHVGLGREGGREGGKEGRKVVENESLRNLIQVQTLHSDRYIHPCIHTLTPSLSPSLPPSLQHTNKHTNRLSHPHPHTHTHPHLYRYIPTHMRPPSLPPSLRTCPFRPVSMTKRGSKEGHMLVVLLCIIRAKFISLLPALYCWASLQGSAQHLGGGGGGKEGRREGK